MQCCKLGHKCPGYTNFRTPFVNLDTGNFEGHNTRELLRKATTEVKSNSLQPSPEITKVANRRAIATNSTIHSNDSRVSHDSPSLSVSATDLNVASGTVCSDPTNAFLLNTTNFRCIYESLWNVFCNEYCITSNYWPCGLAQLANRNAVFDLALVALSAKRISFTGHPEFLHMSYEAYGKCLYLFRCQLGRLRGESNALWATISLIFALFEASSLDLAELFKPEHEPFKHLRGAVSLMKECGPRPFASFGYHEAFQKIREKAVRCALLW